MVRIVSKVNGLLVIFCHGTNATNRPLSPGQVHSHCCNWKIGIVSFEIHNDTLHAANMPVYTFTNETTT